jgi:acetyltransferase-like isoleucine patch superfamily enzyme
MKFRRKNNKFSTKNTHSPIEIGKHSYGIENIRITWQGNATVTIGAFCSIANNVTIQLGGNHNLNWATTYPFGHVSNDPPFLEPIPNHPKPSKSLVIGNDVWIGNNVTILGGHTIGDGVVLAAQSHVVTDIPPFEVWGGNPARKIKDRFPPEITIRIMKLAWWQSPDKEIIKIVPLLTQNPTHEILDEIECIMSDRKLEKS